MPSLIRSTESWPSGTLPFSPRVRLLVNEMASEIVDFMGMKPELYRVIEAIRRREEVPFRPAQLVEYDEADQGWTAREVSWNSTTKVWSLTGGMSWGFGANPVLRPFWYSNEAGWQGGGKSMVVRAFKWRCLTGDPVTGGDDAWWFEPSLGVVPGVVTARSSSVNALYTVTCPLFPGIEATFVTPSNRLLTPLSSVDYNAVDVGSSCIIVLGGYDAESPWLLDAQYWIPETISVVECDTSGAAPLSSDELMAFSWLGM